MGRPAGPHCACPDPTAATSLWADHREACRERWQQQQPAATRRAAWCSAPAIRSTQWLHAWCVQAVIRPAGALHSSSPQPGHSTPPSSLLPSPSPKQALALALALVLGLAAQQAAAARLFDTKASARVLRRSVGKRFKDKSGKMVRARLASMPGWLLSCCALCRRRGAQLCPAGWGAADWPRCQALAARCALHVTTSSHRPLCCAPALICPHRLLRAAVQGGGL